jgi:hypothetical protein
VFYILPLSDPSSDDDDERERKERGPFVVGGYGRRKSHININQAIFRCYFTSPYSIVRGQRLTAYLLACYGRG